MRWLLVSACLALCLNANLAGGAEPPLEIADRLELFVDDYLIDKLSGGAVQRLHHPAPQEVSIVFDAPWEGSGCGYHSVFQDGDIYRLYYRGWQLTTQGKKLTQPHPPVTCYAESRDGIHWTKPQLQRLEFGGSKDNNIILTLKSMGGAPGDPAHIAIFKDANPNASADAKYKAIIRSRGPKGLLPYKSADGLAWSPMATKPVITQGAFDSQNLAFWDPLRQEYRCYFRDFRGGVRDIKTATSKDFLTWTEPQWLAYPKAPKEQLYTNQILPYYRAPHIFIGLPTRYVDRGWNASIKAAPELAQREQRAEASRRYGTAVTEGLLMSSRDGQTFHRWPEAFLRPGPARPGSWAYGDQYIAWQIVETPSKLAGAPRELSLYASDGYWTDHSSQLRRYTLRVDGFVSINAPLAGGELVTKPLTFEGDRLELNFASSAAGSVRVEIQDAAGRPLKGFALADSEAMFGDTLQRKAQWKGDPDLAGLAGQTVRLRFALADADLYSFRFVKPGREE